MALFLTILSGVISLAGTVPYMRDVWKGKTKPRVASWLVWATLTGIAAAASLSDKHYASGVLATCMTLGCASVATLGLYKNGALSFEKFDVACLVAALVGIGLWRGFGSPEVAVLAVVAIDVVASLPTIRHAYKAPHEETLAEFVMAGLASLVALLAAGSWVVTAVAYPLYIVAFDLTIAALIITGRRSKAYNETHDEQPLKQNNTVTAKESEE